MVDTRSSTRQCKTLLGVNEIVQTNPDKLRLQDQENPLSALCRLGEVIRGRSAVESKGCSSNMISRYELVDDESKESEDFEGDFVFVDMSESDSLASVEVESVVSEDEPGSKSLSETNKRRYYMDTSTCEDGDSVASVEIGCEDAPVGKSEAETAHRRNSDSDSLASVEIEVESSRDNSEFGSPSKTGKRPHDIETPKNTECESQRSRLDQGSRWAHLRHQMLEGGFILVKRCYIMSPTSTTCTKVTL